MIPALLVDSKGENMMFENWICCQNVMLFNFLEHQTMDEVLESVIPTILLGLLHGTILYIGHRVLPHLVDPVE
jgi:hypothetical protein